MMTSVTRKSKLCSSCSYVKAFTLNTVRSRIKKDDVCDDCKLTAPPSLCSVCVPPMPYKKGEDDDGRCSDCREYNITKDSIFCVICRGIYIPVATSLTAFIHENKAPYQLKVCEYCLTCCMKASELKPWDRSTKMVSSYDSNSKRKVIFT
jgi:hypothetical protein